MAIVAVLKYRNADSTQALNSRFEALFKRGVLSGGTIVPVSSSLEVDVQPFTATSDDGMLITSDGAERVAIPLDQTNIISLFAQYDSAGDPILTINVTEATTFSGLIDKQFHVVFGSVTTLSPATEVANTDISYALRERQDRRGNLIIRGVLENIVDLPPDPNFNFPGDCYVIAPGGSVTPEIHSWDGTAWINITATAAIASDLAQHRANLFPNEIHMTDDQADAATGSSGAPSAANRYVTEVDTRLPSQTENDALVGSDATPPSSTNKYMVESEPITAPTILSFGAPPGAFVQIPVASGPSFVGNGAIGSANRFVSFLDFTLQRGYINSSGVAPNVSGIFKDIFLTLALDPSVDADAEGYFAGDLFIALDNVIDTSVRLVYGKKSGIGIIPKDYTVTATPGNETVPSDVVELLSNIKGRTFDTLVPIPEQNINLRLDLDGLSTYVGSVLETNVIAADEDFTRLSEDPVLGSFFVKNIGVADIFTFENTGLITFGYTSSTGVVQYSAAVALAGVRIGDFFTDGAGVTFEVISVNDGGDNLTIASLETGETPISITTSVGTSVDGSTKVNFNPRDLLLSEMKLSNAVETLRVNRIVRNTNEFSKPLGQVAYGVVMKDARFDPRLVFYGGWENFTNTTQETVVRNNTGIGSFVITGFFTEVSVIMRRRDFSPALDIRIDNVSPPTTLSTSALGTVNVNVEADPGTKLQRVQLISGLPSGRPNTLSATITALTADPLEIFGFELIRADSESVALLESGRAFDQARIVQRDTIDPAVAIPALGLLSRGGRLVYSVIDTSFSTAIFAMQDLDEGGTPNGTVNATTSEVTITVGAAKLVSYRVGDIITIFDLALSLSEIRRIVSIASPIVTVDAATGFAPATAVGIRHLCSTNQTIPLAEEDFTTRYVILNEFIDNTPRDFSSPDEKDRFVLHRDGQTILAAENTTVTTTGISGAPRAIQASFASSGVIRIRAMCTRLDLLVVNAAAGTANITIDGSSAVPFTWGVGAQRRTIFFNARYQAHEIIITPTAGNVSLTEIMLFGPFKPRITGFPNEVGDLSRVARYEASRSTLVSAPSVYPLGAVFYEQTYLSYINGTGAGVDWVVADDFTKSIYGRYIASDREVSFIEFYFLGTSFELQFITGPNHGTFKVQVDGTQLELTGATINGDYTGSEVDAYTAGYSRRNIGAEGLSYGYHKVTAGVKATRTKNGSSTGFLIAFAGYYVGNENGLMSYGLNREGNYTDLVDTRNFIPIEILEDAVTTISAAERANKVSLTVSTTSVAVVFANPYADNNYVVTATLLNTVDALPTYQPLVVTAQSPTGFTVAWNTPLPTGSYVLMYQSSSLI